MPITFLDEEEEIVPVAPKKTGKRRINPLDEEEPPEEEGVKPESEVITTTSGRKITFLDEEEEPIAPVVEPETPSASEPPTRITFLDEEPEPPTIGGLSIPPAPEVTKFEATKPKESFLRPVADPFLNIGAGINDVLKGFTDAFGADNAVSQNLAKNSEWYRGLLSAGAKQDQEEIGRIMQEAEGQGVLSEIGAGLKALSVAPVDLVSQGIGSLIPFIATAGVGKAVGLSKAGIAVLQGVQGGLGGGGVVKGEIYDAVKDQLVNSGVDEDKAEKAAQEAQAYNGKNLVQIMLGVGLGVAASTTGADSAIRSLISRKVGKETAEQVSEQAVQEVLRTGFVRGAVKDGAVEFATEALQGGQERLAANVAVGREGFDVEPMRGVVGQATLEGALGGILGGGAGGISARVAQRDAREAVALRDAQKAAEEAKQNNSPASAAAVEEQIEQVGETLNIPATVTPRREGETDQQWRARIEQERAETPDQRVARLQREAQEGVDIELEEEVSGLPAQSVTPTPEAPPVTPVAPVEPVVPVEGAVEPVVTEAPAETITQAFTQMGEGAVDSYYQAVLQSLQESGEVPTPERRSNVGQAWERVRGQMTPEEFVVQLRQNAEDPSRIQAPEAAPVTPTPTEVAPTPTAEPPALAPLRRVAKAEQTEEDVSGLVGQGLVELYNGQPVITQAGLEALPEAERPRLTPEARKIQIDTGSNEVVAEVISKGLRIGVDQVGPNVTMPQGWTLDGDIYIPPVVEAAPEFAFAQEVEAKKQNIKTNMIRFASGMSGISDLRAGAYTRAGFKNYGVGFDVGLLSKNAIEELADFIINMDTQAFIDSGAFSNFRKSLKAQEGGKTVEALNFDKIFEKYDAILDAIQRINVAERTDYPRPMIVMPDIIGDQNASLDLIDKYKNRVSLEVSSNTSIPIIPVPLGELSLSEAYNRIIEILKTNTIGSEINPENFVVGIPSNAKAVSKEDLAKFLRESKPPRIHFLGAAADRNISPLIDIVSQNSPETQVTADASKVRSAILSGVAKGKTRKRAIFDALYQEDDPEVVLNAATAPQPEARESRVARDPEVQKAAQDLKDGRIDRDEYQRIVDMRMPLRKFEAVPTPANNKDMLRGLGERKAGDRLKKDLIQDPESIAEGTVLEARLDIPAYESENVWVVSLHKQRTDLQKGTAAEVVAYTPTSVLRNVTFGVTEKAAAGIAAGKPKSTIATMRGEYVPMTAEQAYELATTNKDKWVEIGMNPVRHSYFYDKDTQTPVESAEEVVQVGGMVLAKNPVFGKKEDYLYSLREAQPTVGMTTNAVRARLEALGFGVEGMIRIVEDPQAAFEGRTIIQDGKAVRIELNASALRDNAAIDRVLNHEFAEAANADGALNRLVERLTPKEKKEINDAITRLGYEERVRNIEEAARAIEALAAGWKGRGFFERAVARVEAWGSKLGLKLTRRAAEYIAARNLSDVNAGFKAAYEQSINRVAGEEARYSYAGMLAVTPRFMRDSLKAAQSMAAAGKTNEEIRLATGWFKGKYDNKLRWEIPDYKSFIKKDATNKLRDGGDVRLEDVLEHPELYAAYPDAKRIKVYLMKKDEGASYAANTIGVNPFSKFEGFNFRNAMLHEIQHWIQDKEGFASGTSPERFVHPMSRLKEDLKEAEDGLSEIRREWYDSDEEYQKEREGWAWEVDLYKKIIRAKERGLGTYQIYQLAAGEIEANDVERRNSMDEESRKRYEPYAFSKVSPKDAIAMDVRGAMPTSVEIRESRREPAPTFTEESPEAKTLSNLKASMEKVDAASEAKGGKPETQKVSEIAANWMEQGGDERALQDAITENTNLSPVNAAKVAKVIAKQYGLQQQIAETGAVIAEITPEAEGAPRKSSVTKLIEQTTGVRKPVVKLQVSESAALKKQIQLKAREARETRKARKARKEAAEDLAKSITDYVKANPIRGPINSRQAMSITKRALKLDVNNEAAVDRFEMYVERVIENANYDQDLADARALIKRAKAFAKSKDTQGNVKTTLDAIANISPTLLDNPFEFNLVVQRYLLGLAPVTAKQYAVMPDADVRRYLESLETQISANQDVLDRSKAQRILDRQAAYADEKGIPLDEAISILNSEEFLNEKTIEKLEDLTKLLTSMAQESQKDVRAYDETGATPKQKELISFMGKVNLDSLTNEEKKRYIRFSNNLLANGATFGMEQFQSIALGQESAIKALKDKRLSNKLAAWISPIGGDGAIDTARKIALRTQSEADTFKNIFGREAVGVFRNILGLNRLDVAQTDSNRAKEQIANEFGEYFKGLRKKYGNDATGFEAKGYAGIAGYLIQTDGIKTEAESIPYRRRLMEQNIVELRKSDKRADLAEADLKERALAQLTGTSNAEIMSQLQALNPASYEQLMWVKDVMLPKWRDFLKEHDENFRNQANNYNNPDHLTITYKFPEGQLLPNEIEDVYQQDAIGMRIKQAANSIKRKEHSNLPVSPRTGTVANIDINFGYNQYNALVDQVDKAFVAPAWEQVVAFTKAPEFEQVMGGRANSLFVKKLLTDIQTSRTRQSMTDDEAQMVAGGVRLARKISTQAVLGGFTQPLRQVPDQLTKLFLTTGRWDLITKNLLRIAEAAPLLNKFPIGRRGDAQAGTQYASQFSELARKVEASVTDRKWAQYRELMNRVGEFWMAPLRGSDVWAAKVSWMSYYEAELNKNGIKMESWEREAELVETDDARKEAASYAEFAVDFYGGASDPTKMASLSKQTNNGWKEFAKLLFLPLNSFALQQKNSLISDLRDAYLRTGDRKASIAAIAGTLAGMAAFHGMRIYIIGGLLYPAGKALLMGIFGIDMDEPDEEEKQKKLEDDWRKFKASMYGNIVAGGAGEFAEKAAIDAVNRTAYLWDANINPDSLLNDKGEIMSFRQYEKEVSPLYRFRSYGSSEYSFGLADVLTEQATHSLAETQQLLTPEEMERYTGNEQAYAAFATGVEWMYFFRLMDTDVKRIATDLKRQMDKQVEEREKYIKSIRSGR